MRHRRLLLAVTLALVVAVVLPFAALAAPSAQVPPIPHALEGFANCTTCHQVGGAGTGAAGGTGMPAGHASFTNAQCTSCHQVAQAPAPAATATTAPAAASPTAPAAAATATPAEGKGVAEPTATTAPAATAAPTLPRTGSVPPQALFFAGTAIIGLAAVVRRMVSR